MSFIKITYFDESFVADFMQIIAGGEMKQTTEFISQLNAGVEGEGNVEVGATNNKLGIPKLLEFLTGTHISGSAKIGGNISYNKDKIVKNILENTLLADFLALVKNDKKRKASNKRCAGIKVFPSLKVKPEPNSFTFFMLAAPFMSMLNGDIPVKGNDGNNFTLDIKKIGDAIDSGRGYYEFIAQIEDEEIILRFNISAFRNNYTMSDLPKMELTYYAIYVGKSEKEQLNIEKEFQFGVKNSSRADYTGLSESENTMKELSVYDVVLAGIED